MIRSVLVPVAAVAAATGIAELMSGDRAILASLPFMLAVVVAAAAGGILAGIVASALATAALAFFTLPPRAAFPPTADAGVALASLLAASLVVSWVVARLRAAVGDRDRARAAAESRLAEVQAILSGVEDGLTVQDRSGELVYANEAAARLMGFGSAAELVSTPVAQIMARFEVLDEAGRPFPLHRLPGRRALLGERAPPVTLRYRNAATGEERWSVVRATPIGGDERRPLMVVNVFQDVTAERWSREAGRLLAEITDELLAASLDFEATLRRLGDLAVPRLGDLSVVYLAENGGPRRVHVSHADPDLQERIRGLADQIGAAVRPGSPVLDVIASGEPRLFTEIPEHLLEQQPLDAEQKEAVRSLDIGSAMILPLRGRRKVIGAIVLARQGAARPYDQADLSMAMELAGRAAVAVENAGLHDAELRARAQAEETAARLSRLQRVTAALSGASTSAEVARAVLEEGLQALGARAGSVALLGHDRSTLSVGWTVGYPDDVVRAGESFPVDAPVPLAEAVRTGSPVYIDSPQALEEAYPHLRGADDRAWAALPLRRDGTTLGAIGLSFDAERSFSEADRQFMRVLADQCSQALERARLYESEREARADAVRAQERLNFLAEANEALSGSLQYDRTLRRLVKLCVPRLAEWCIVDVVEQDGSIQQVAVEHADPAKTELAREVRRRYPPEERDHPIPRVIESGMPELREDISDEEIEKQALDEAHARMLRELGIRSHIVVPLTARGRTIGAMSFVNGPDAPRYGLADLALAEELARRAALALDNARLYQDRSRVARTLQQSLLPGRLPEIPGVEVAARYRPAAEGIDVGGDFYDVFERGDGRWMFVIGDVTGKGAEAAALTALTRYTIRTAALEERRDPAEILSVLNGAVLREAVDRFCTVILAQLDLNGAAPTLRVACAGHPLPLLLALDGSVRPVGEPGTLVGAVPELKLKQIDTELAPGDAVVFYTDGLIDAARSGAVPEENRLTELVRLCVGLDADLLTSRIERHATTFQGGAPRDDLALVALRVSPR